MPETRTSQPLGTIERPLALRMTRVIKTAVYRCMMIRTMPLPLLALMLLSSGCVSMQNSNMVMRPDGKMGISGTGTVQFSHDREQATAAVQQIMNKICAGNARIIQLNLQDADSLAGVHHMYYIVTAECI